MKKKVVPKLRQEVKVKVDIVTSGDIKIYYTGKFQDFTARYIIKFVMAILHGKQGLLCDKSVSPGIYLKKKKNCVNI